MKKFFLLILLIPNLVTAELKPLSSNKEISEAMTLYRIQRCSGFYYASEWLFNISNKTEMAKSMNDRAIEPKGPNLPKALAILPKPFFNLRPTFLKAPAICLPFFLNHPISLTTRLLSLI